MALTRREVVRTTRLTQRDVARLASRLYVAKAAEYREALLELSRQYGAPRSRVLLSAEIREALRRESRDHARKIVRTFNRELEAEARRRGDLPAYLLARHLQGWSTRRNARRSPMIARNELATARLDAQVSFYVENGLEALFDFKGPVAKCAVCRRLKAGADGNGAPWPIEVVLRIGHPHIGCRHGWKARTRSAAKVRAGGVRPGQVSAGRGRVAGIVGGEALVNREGSINDAVAFLEQFDAAVAA